MWHLCTEMSKEDHLIITKKIEYTLCEHSVIMNEKKRLHVEGVPQCAASFFVRHCLF